MANNIQNPLGKYASYNNLWTFYAPSKDSFNTGEWANTIENVVLSSAGRDDNKRVQTLYGRPEFFINNITLDAIIVPNDSAGNSAQQKIEFEIFEPYSMGLFLQSCQVAAMNAGWPSYLEAPYVLRLDIVGQSAYTEFSQVGPFRFCMKIIKATFTTDESGSTYKVEAIPHNDQAFNTTVNTIQSDVKLVGMSAAEILISNPTNNLTTVLNDRENELVKSGKKLIPDKYSIVFSPQDWGGPNPFEDPNAGGSFDFQPETKGGTEIQHRAEDVYDSDGKVMREKVILIPQVKTFQYSSKTSITGLIDSVILSTRHARSAGTGNTNLDAEGCITWWRLDTEIKFLEYDSSINEFAKHYIFKIVPFKVHHSVFMTPGAASEGVDAIKNAASKKYYYIYTGLNTEVIKWNIEIENQFFTAVSPNSPETTGVQATPGIHNSVSSPVAKVEPAEGKATETSPEGGASRVAPSSRASKNPIPGGAGAKDTAQRVADEFYNAAFKGLDKLNLELEIQGDPYWLPQAGQPNYNSSGGGTPVTEDGTMNHENRAIFIEMIFRTPYDTEGGTGLYKFMDAGFPSPFGGVYQVTTVTSKWNDNHFTQTVNGFRIPAQDQTGSKGRVPNPIKEWIDESPTLGG